MGTEYPWTDDKQMKNQLETAGWRYAILIGITGSPDQIDKYADDQVTYKHLIKKNEQGRSIWNCKEAAEFVHDTTGYPLDICNQWLEYDWSA